MNYQSFDDNAAMVAALSERIARCLADAIAARGEASLLVSGGRSPIALFKALRTRSLAWDKVTVSLVDDRWVTADDEASNARLVREHLLQDAAAAARFVPLAGDEASPEAGMTAALTRFSPLADGADVLVLGMGEDGHTASIFPCAAERDQALAMDHDAPLIAVHPTTAPHARISLTLAAILKCRQLFLPLAGKGKQAVYQQALAGSDPRELPIRAILQQDLVPLDVLYSEQ